MATVNVLTLEKWLSPSLMRGTVGKALLGLMTRVPNFMWYRLLITSSRSDVFFTGRNRLRGTLMPDDKTTALLVSGAQRQLDEASLLYLLAGFPMAS